MSSTDLRRRDETNEKEEEEEVQQGDEGPTRLTRREMFVDRLLINEIFIELIDEKKRDEGKREEREIPRPCA